MRLKPLGRNVSTPKAQSSPETHQPLQAPSARVSQACPHGRTRDMQLERLAGSLGFLCVSHTRIPEPTGFFKYEEAESPKLCSSTEFNPKQPVSTFRPRGLAVSTLRPVLKNKSDSFNSRPVTKVHINQAVFRTLVKLFQIQDPLYKKLRTRTTGQVQSPTSGSSGDHLAPPPPEACIHPPQHSRQAALCHFGWLSVCLPPCRSDRRGRRGERRTQDAGVSVRSPPSPLDRHARGSGQRRLLLGGDRGLGTEAVLSTLLWALEKPVSSTEKPVSSTVSTKLKSCQILWHKPEISAPWEAEAKRLQVQG